MPSSLIALDLALAPDPSRAGDRAPHHIAPAVDVLEPHIPGMQRTARALLRPAIRGPQQVLTDVHGTTYAARAALPSGSQASVSLAVCKQQRKARQVVTLKTVELGELASLDIPEEERVPFVLREFDVMLRSQSPLSPVALLAVCAARPSFFSTCSLKILQIVAVLPVIACDAEAINRQVAKTASEDRRTLARYTLERGLERLAPLHQDDTVHGDLRKRNVFFDFCGDVHIGDFGLAAKSHDRSISGGALTYWPPSAVERAINPCKPRPSRSPRDDLWSFGLCVLNLLAGDNPLQYGVNASTDRFLAATLRQHLKASLAGTSVNDSPHAQYVDAVVKRAERSAPELLYLLRKMLNFDATAAPRDATAMRQQIANVGLTSMGLQRNRVTKLFFQMEIFPTWRLVAKLRRDK